MKRIILTALAVLTLVMAPAAVFNGQAAAACPAATANDAQSQVLHGVNETGSTCSETGVTNVFRVAAQILTIIAGALAVIMVIYAGIKYTTSGGDASKVASAKQALIYALVGVAIVILSQLLINFVIGTSKDAATNATPAAAPAAPATPTCATNPNLSASSGFCVPAGTPVPATCPTDNSIPATSASCQAAPTPAPAPAPATPCPTNPNIPAGPGCQPSCPATPSIPIGSPACACPTKPAIPTSDPQCLP